MNMKGLVKSSLLIPTGMLLNFLMTIYLSRILNIAEFGAYSLILQWANLIAITASCGLPMMGQRALPAYTEQRQLDKLRQYMRIVDIVLVSAVLASVFTLLIIPFCLIDYIISATVLCASINIAWLFQRYLALGNDDVTQAILPRDVLFPIALVAGVALLKIEDLTSLMILYICTLGVIIISSLYSTRKKAFVNTIGIKAGSLSFLKTVKESFPFSVTSFGQLGLNGVEILVVGIFLSSEDVGLYALALKISLVSGLIIRVINVSTGQWFARLYAGNNIEKFMDLYKNMRILSSMVSVSVLVVVLVYAQDLLGAINEGYVAGYLVLVILVVGQTVVALFGPVSIGLNMMGKQGSVAAITSKFAVLNIIICSVAIVSFGLIGVACSVAFCNIMSKYSQFNIFLRSAKLES